MDVFGLKEEDAVPGEQGNSTLKGAGNIPQSLVHCYMTASHRCCTAMIRISCPHHIPDLVTGAHLSAVKQKLLSEMSLACDSIKLSDFRVLLKRLIIEIAFWS